MDQFNQYAALPYVVVDNKPLLLLATSRETRRWVLPKGWHKDGLEPHELAELEALEEVGLKGTISSTPLGWYTYTKRLHFFSRVTCKVDIFALKADHHLLDWAEKNQRDLAWVSPGDAANMVSERELTSLLETITLLDTELTVHPTETTGV
ncbi:NUDIX hydrolase [Coralliovum pocilloporae]|uniref:NUDIX hydrolase n=1 Tax=Coralliovum pocilloporae TaxID=3066369 RepID=UPI003307A0A6